MKRLSWVAFSVLLLALSTGCGSSPPVRYYSLDAVSASYGADADDSPIVGLGPLQLPDYLKRPQLVTRGRGTQMNVDDYARWAEPIEQALHRVLATNVDGLLDDTIVVAYPYTNTVDVHYRVLGQVDRFDADAAGSVVLIVQWTLVDRERNALVVPQRRRYEASADDANDPNTIAQAMNATLMQFAEDIAAQAGPAVR